MLELHKGNNAYCIENKILYRLKEVEKYIIKKTYVLEPWEVRHAKYIDFGNYDFLDDWQELRIGDFWAKSGETAFIRKEAVLDDCKDEYIALYLKTDGEGLLYVNGKPFHGADDFRGYICLTPSGRECEQFSLMLEQKAGGYEDFEDKPDRHIFSEAEIKYIDKEIESIYYDYYVPFDVGANHKDKVMSDLLLNLVYDSLMNIDFYTDKTTVREQIIKENAAFRKKLKDLPKAPGYVHFIGNSHIDLAFMWPKRETERKVGRTFSSLCRLMEEFPNYHFMCSQVPIYEYLKKNYPEIYSEIKELVKEKRFEPIGGVYVQSDINLLGGESLVRQCLYGKRFFRKEFDFDVKVGWLPDTFGFAYSLPQIYKQAGIDVLFTQKLRYNDTNSHYDSDHIPSLMFNWEGCDGSSILMYNTGSYKHLTTDSMDFMMYNLGYYYNKAKHLPMPGYLAPYGFGDGGGGVNRKQLEYIKRLPHTPGFPKTETGSVEKFFEKQPKDRLDTVSDELYLEAHRGTYTTQGKIKKYNRQCEIQIRNAEILSVCAGLDNKKELSEIWKKILFNQFHDILPGSTVHEGVTDAHASYEEILEKLKEITDKALKILAQRQETEGKGQAVMVFNPLSFTREDIAEISLSDLPVRDNITVRNSMGERVHCQVSGDRLLFETQTFPMASSVYYIEEKTGGNKGIPFRGTKNIFSNSFYEIEFGRDGYIRKIFDKELEKEILSGRSNVFQVFEDRCGYFDAWDIDPQFENHKSEFFCVNPPAVTEKGSLRMTVRTEYAFGRSKIVQDMILYRNIKRIDFETYADWQEEHLMLKTAFETSVRTSFASYEIPYGIIRRPTTRNNSYEKGKFEVCGQRWADLSAPDFGVSLLNDCKYGWDIKDNVMRLTLLRSPKFPDATADMGEHRFTYSLLSHGTGLEGTVKEAHKLNNPLYAITADKHKGVNDFLLTTSDDIIIDCVKEAEDSSDIIVRLYEPYGRRTLGFILFGKKVEEIRETDILEEKTESADLADNMLLKFVIKPFEIKTYRLKLKI